MIIGVALYSGHSIFYAMNPLNAINLYASLSELRSYFTYTDTEAQASNDDLRFYLYTASRAIDKYTRVKFYPHVRVKYFDYPEDGKTVKVGQHLEVLSLYGDNGDQEIPNSIILSRCGCEWNLTPYDTLELRDSAGSSFQWSGDKRRSITATLLTGYRSEYDLPDEPWIDTSAVLTASLASSVDVVQSSASGGMNKFGFAPRFGESQIWRLGSGASQELVLVGTTGYQGEAASTLVVRGINGTTAASHASGTPVYAWNPEPEIKMATLRLARWFYEVRNNPTGQRHFFPQFGGFELADAWPKDIKMTLDRYRPFEMGSF